MKKIIAGFIAAALVSSIAFADDLKINFYNKLFSDDYLIGHHEKDGVKKTGVDFPGIKERMRAEIFTERVDAMVKVTMLLDDRDSYDAADPKANTEHYAITGKLNDFYVEFRPVHQFTLGFHTGIYPDGSALPIYDDNVGSANIGSDGFTASWRPSALKDALRISVSTPFGYNDDPNNDFNWLNGNKNNGERSTGGATDVFDIRSGAIFTQELFQVGVSVQDILDDDERQVGAFVNLPTLLGLLKPMTIGGGFTHSENVKTVFDDLIGKNGHFVVSDDEWVDDGTGNYSWVHDGNCAHGLSYKDLFSSYLTMEFDHFNLVAEMLYNFSAENGGKFTGSQPYDMYGACAISFGLYKFTATATGKFLKDFTSNGAKNVYFGGFGIDFDINDQNQVGVALEVDTCDNDWHAAIPVFWKYHFEK